MPGMSLLLSHLVVCNLKLVLLCSIQDPSNFYPKIQEPSRHQETHWLLPWNPWVTIWYGWSSPSPAHGKHIYLSRAFSYCPSTKAVRVAYVVLLLLHFVLRTSLCGRLGWKREWLSQNHLTIWIQVSKSLVLIHTTRHWPRAAMLPVGNGNPLPPLPNRNKKGTPTAGSIVSGAAPLPV